jgi:hypothetical protein
VDWILVVFFLVHFFMIATGKAVFMRYYLSLVPILVIAAAALIVRVAERLVPDRTRRQVPVVAILTVVCGFQGSWVSVRQDALLSRTDTRVEARRWMEQNLPGGTRVGVPTDWWTRTQWEFYSYGKPSIPPGSRYQAVRPEQVRSSGVEYVLVDESPLLLYSPPERRAWSDWLARNAVQVAEFDPFTKPLDEVRAVYDQLDAFYVPVARFSGVRRPGPRIRVYRLKPNAG